MRPSSVVHAGRSRVARTSSASRACQAVPARQCRVSSTAQGIEPRLRLGVVLGQAGQHVEQPAHRGHADVVVEHRPPDLEDRDEVVLDEHVVGQRPGVAPSRRPALEPQGAGGEHGVRRLLRRERARVDGAAGDEDVGERRQLFLPRRGQRARAADAGTSPASRSRSITAAVDSPDATAAAGAWARARRLASRRIGASSRRRRDDSRNARACAGDAKPSASRRCSRSSARSNIAWSAPRQQRVEPVELGSRVRERPAGAHHPRERGGVRGIELGQHVDDGVPGVRATRDDPAAGDLAGEAAVRLDHRRDLRAVGGDVAVQGGDVEDADVLRETGRDEIGVEPGDGPRRHVGALLHQHLDPHAEPIGVELLVEAGVRAPPQVEIEDARDLRRRRQRDELAAVLEPAALDDAVQQLGRQPRHDLGELRRVQDAIEQAAPIAADERAPAGELLHATSGKTDGRNRSP